MVYTDLHTSLQTSVLAQQELTHSCTVYGLIQIVSAGRGHGGGGKRRTNGVHRPKRP